MYYSLSLPIVQLFYRSVRIVSELAGVVEERARLALLGAIYQEDSVGKVTLTTHHLFNHSNPFNSFPEIFS